MKCFLILVINDLLEFCGFQLVNDFNCSLWSSIQEKKNHCYYDLEIIIFTQSCATQSIQRSRREWKMFLMAVEFNYSNLSIAVSKQQKAVIYAVVVLKIISWLGCLLGMLRICLVLTKFEVESDDEATWTVKIDIIEFLFII